MSGERRPQCFGRRWNAPAFQDATMVPVPVGGQCLFCKDTVGESDSGLVIPAVQGDGTLSTQPVHIECYLRMMSGPVAHLERRCACYHGSAAHEEPTHDSARAVMTWLLAERARQGRPVWAD